MNPEVRSRDPKIIVARVLYCRAKIVMMGARSMAMEKFSPPMKA